jgi:hypothetical protein
MASSLYVYLARLDKKGMKVIGSIPFGQKVYATKVSDIEKLNLKPELSAKIAKEAYENRMMYELYLESADSFEDLKGSLRKRGYSSLPMSQFTGFESATSVNKNALVTISSTMLRRNSDTKR